VFPLSFAVAICHPFYFSFEPPATPVLYILSLHDALPISAVASLASTAMARAEFFDSRDVFGGGPNFFQGGVSPIPRETVMFQGRSEEHTSELQSHLNLVCRLLLEKKKKTNTTDIIQNVTI